MKALPWKEIERKIFSPDTVNTWVLQQSCKLWKGDKDDFADIVRMAIEDCEISQTKLADEFQVAQSTVSRWIHGVAKPHPKLQSLVVKTILRLAKEKEKEKTGHRPNRKGRSKWTKT